MTNIIQEQRRLRALREAYRHGCNQHEGYCRTRKVKQAKTEYPDYEPKSLIRLNEAMAAFNFREATEQQLEDMLRMLWLYAVHSWAEPRWRFYVAGLIREPGEL